MTTHRRASSTPMKMMIAGIEIPIYVSKMSWPLGDTGVGKMGEIPPGASQELSRRTAGRMASGHSLARENPTKSGDFAGTP
jgi:hypothetical protein